MSKRTSAARYARALLDVAVSESTEDRAGRDLATFADLVRANPELQRTLANPVVAAADKRAVVQQLVDRLQPVAPVGKLLLLLASRGRLTLLPDVVDVYRERLMAHQGVIRAEVTTAEPLRRKPVVTANQPGIRKVTVPAKRVTRLGPNQYKVVIRTKDQGPAGDMKVRVTGIDSAGGTNTKVFTVRLR